MRGARGDAQLFHVIVAVEDKTPEQIRSVIAEHGWWVDIIMADKESPGFAYTIGLYERFGHPELIVVGLPPDVMHGVLNECGSMIASGTRFEPGKPVDNVLAGYPVQFRRVLAERSYAEYLRYGFRHYGGPAFPVL